VSEVPLSKLIVKFSKNILFGLAIGALVSSFILEVMTEPEDKVFFKVIGYCDFNTQNVSLLGFIYNYWKVRDVKVNTIKNKHSLVEGLLVLTEFKDNGCNTRILKELRDIELQGYKYNEYRSDKGKSWVLREVLVGNSLTVGWLIDLGGFINTKVTDEDSPYKDQDIFELAVSLNEKHPTSSRKIIINLLELQEK